MASAHAQFFGMVALALTGAGAMAAERPDALPWGSDPPAGPAMARVAAITSVGRQMFFDKTLSASGSMSCATCHDPAHGFGPPGAEPIIMGGARLDKPGTRAVPGLTYSAATPFFSEHF